jgi:hypothetical protein
VAAAGFGLAGASLSAAISHESASEDVVLELAVEGIQDERACIDLWGRLSDLVGDGGSTAPFDFWLTERLALVVRAA